MTDKKNPGSELFRKRFETFKKLSQEMGEQKEGNIGIFTGLPESMAGRRVQKAKNFLLKM